jgi:hypothetical protein
MVEPVSRTHEISRECESVACTVFPSEVLEAGIYSSTNIGGSRVLTYAVEESFPELTGYEVAIRREGVA